MTREPWTGEPPVLSSIPCASYWKETDDDGSIWFVALGLDGSVVEHALLEAGGLRKQHEDQVRAIAATEREALNVKDARIAELREKAVHMTISDSERNELVLLLCDLLRPEK